MRKFLKEIQTPKHLIDGDMKAAMALISFAMMGFLCLLIGGAV